MDPRPTAAPAPFRASPQSTDIQTEDVGAAVALPDSGQSTLSFGNNFGGSTSANNFDSFYTVPSGKVFVMDSCVITSPYSMLVELNQASGVKYGSGWVAAGVPLNLLNGSVAAPAGTALRVRIPPQSPTQTVNISYSITGSLQDVQAGGVDTPQLSQIITPPLG